MRSMRGMRIGLGLALTSCIMAVVVIRVPLLWRFLPTRSINQLLSLFNIETQEAASTAEFLLIWLLSFLLVIVFVLLTSLIRRRS